MDTNGRAQTLLALYHDECRRESGVWRIARRRLESKYQGPLDLSGPRPSR